MACAVLQVFDAFDISGDGVISFYEATRAHCHAHSSTTTVTALPYRAHCNRICCTCASATSHCKPSLLSHVSAC